MDIDNVEFTPFQSCLNLVSDICCSLGNILTMQNLLLSPIPGEERNSISYKIRSLALFEYYKWLNKIKKYKESYKISICWRPFFICRYQLLFDKQKFRPAFCGWR